MSHGHAINRKTYWIVFVALALLTLLEVGVAYVQGMRNLVIVSLITLALAKAACVLLFYMHLRGESPALKKTVVLPFVFPAGYAFILIAEAIYRGGWALFS